MPTPKQIETPDTEPPDNPPSPEETTSKLGVIAAVCFLLPVLYFLSIGPMAWVLHHGYMPSAMEDYLGIFYWPLIYLAKNWEPSSWFLDQYMVLWGITP